MYDELTPSPRAAPRPSGVAARDWRRLRKRLLDEASQPYRRAGHFAYHFARGKLGHDPVFRAILEQGLLRGRTQILDLGCGQALLSAWLNAAASNYERGQWPAGWPPPPTALSVRGIELKQRDVARARRALGPGCGIVQGDIRSAAFGRADAVVILDVLHYLSGSSQRDVLKRVRQVLSPGGVLLLRVGDADAGLRFRITRWSDRVATLSRGHRLIALHCRGLRSWLELLRECRFETDPQPMSAGTPFANVLLIARAV